MRKKLLFSFVSLFFVSAVFAAGHTVSITSKNVTCGGGINDGSAIANVTGGTGPFTYLWSSSATSQTAINLAAGSYTVTVTDGSDQSTATSAVTITEPPQLIATISSVTNATCGLPNGQVVAQATGGTGAYSYTWDKGSNSATASGLASGAYTVTVTDVNGCSATTAAVVANVPGPVLQTSAVQQPKCNGTCDGIATVNLLGGTPPYTYLWGPMGASTQMVTGLCAGQYTLTVTDAKGCMGISTVIVPQLSDTSLKITASLLQNATCYGVCDGVATANVTGGTTPYTYFWSPQNKPEYNNLKTNLCQATYTVSVTDALGCTAFTSGFVVTEPLLTGVLVTETITKESCYQTGDGTINLNVTGPNANSLTYKWSNNAITKDVFNVKSGNYSVKIFNSDSSACLTKFYNVTMDGKDCGSISGNVFIDTSSNCLYDSGEQLFSGAIVTANPGNRVAFSDLNGNYSFNNMAYNTYSITHTGNSYTAPSCGSTQSVAVSSGVPNKYNINFADTASSQIDVGVSSSCWNVVPGFQGYYFIYLQSLNPLASAVSGTLKAMLPSGIGAAISTCSPAGYTISGDTVTWNYSGLTSNYNLAFSINFTLPVNTPLSSLFKCCATAFVNGADVNLSNNSNCSEATVRGSWDPNDKAVSPVGPPAQNGITLNDKELIYRIRFQNTGNGPAVNIMVKDTLSDKLDISTLQMIEFSHNCTFDILSGNVMRWRFNNINLPDSGSNEPGSHGYILYRVKQKQGNQIGDVIKNTAYIYFDFNEAVITNTTVSKLVVPLGVNELVSKNGNVLVYPNPFSESTTFELLHAPASGSYSFELSDVLGKRVQRMENLQGTTFRVSRAGLNKGIYFYKITSQEATIASGKLVVE